MFVSVTVWNYLYNDHKTAETGCQEYKARIKANMLDCKRSKFS